MNGLIAAVNLNSADVEEGQLPDDGYQQEPVKHDHSQAQSHTSTRQGSSFHHPSIIQASLPRHAPINNTHQEDCSGEIVLEVVEDKFYRNSHNVDDRKSKKIVKTDVKPKLQNTPPPREKDKYPERLEKQRKTQRNEKKSYMPTTYEREEMKTTPSNLALNPNPSYPPQPYYSQYGYPPQPPQMQMGQYPPYPPYPYPYMQQAQPPFNGMPPVPQYPHSNIPNLQQNPFKQQFVSHQPQYPQYPTDRPPHNGQQHYRPPPQPYSQYPSYPSYNPYDHYDRHREAQQRQEKQRAQRKKDFVDELRGQLKKNIKQFNKEESLDLLEAVKCVLKFKPQHQNEPKDTVSHRSYERSLLRIQLWLENDSPSLREFTKGLLTAMQMEDLISKTKQQKTPLKEQGEKVEVTRHVPVDPRR